MRVLLDESLDVTPRAKICRKITYRVAQDAIDKGAFRSKGTTSLDGQPNMLNITRTATEIAGAMSYLHSLDILHSDLNGNNILLISNTGIDDRPFSVKVCFQRFARPALLDYLNYLLKAWQAVWGCLL